MTHVRPKILALSAALSLVVAIAQAQQSKPKAPDNAPGATTRRSGPRGSS